MVFERSGGERLTVRVGLGPRAVGNPSDGEILARARPMSESTDRPASEVDGDGGALRRMSLRYLDDALERRYQRASGASLTDPYHDRCRRGSLAAGGCRRPDRHISTVERAFIVCFGSGLLNWAAFVLADRFETLDRQHAVPSFLTSVNGLVILWLASTGGVLPGYGISAIMLLFAFGFVSRTGFVYAASRSAVIVLGSVVTAVLYQGRAAFCGRSSSGGRGRHARRTASPRAVTPSRLLSGHRHHAASRRVTDREGESRRPDRKPASSSISSRLLAGERAIADDYPAVTVLFADIVGFTPLAARLPADDVVALLGRLFARFDELVAERGLEKIKTIGDAYMAAGGLPEPLGDHAARVVDLGLAMIDAAAHASDGIAHLRLRVGVHSGPVIGGVIGHRKLAFDIWGETVNIASRLESQGQPGRVIVSAATWSWRAFSTRNIASDAPSRIRSDGHVRDHRAPQREPRARRRRDRFDRTSGARGVRGAPGAHQSPEGIGKGATTGRPITTYAGANHEP